MNWTFPFGRVLVPRGILPHRVDVLRHNDISDDAGGTIPQPVVVKRNVSCWVIPLSGSEQEEFFRRDLVLTDKVIFFDDPGVLNTDVLLFGTRSLVVNSTSNELSMDIGWVVMTRDIAYKAP